MNTFQISGVDQQGVEAILVNPLPGADFSFLVGRPVEFARKTVGQIVRIYRDSVGPWVCKVALGDMNALRLSATGCLTAVNVGADSITLSDRPGDIGKSFQYTGADGMKLAKRFTGLAEADRDNPLFKSASAEEKFIPLRKNQEYALLIKGTEFESRSQSHRNPTPRVNPNSGAGETWPNSTPSIGVAREIIPNANAFLRDRSNG